MKKQYQSPIIESFKVLTTGMVCNSGTVTNVVYNGGGSGTDDIGYGGAGDGTDTGGGQPRARENDWEYWDEDENEE